MKMDQLARAAQTIHTNPESAGDLSIEATSDEKEALARMARREQAGESLPSHMKRAKEGVIWFAEA